MNADPYVAAGGIPAWAPTSPSLAPPPQVGLHKATQIPPQQSTVSSVVQNSPVGHSELERHN